MQLLAVEWQEAVIVPFGFLIQCKIHLRKIVRILAACNLIPILEAQLRLC